MEGLSFPTTAVRQVLEDGVTAMLADAKILTWAFRTLPDKFRDSFRTALTIREGKIRTGYPREPYEDWGITLLLVATANLATIGDMIGDTSNETIALATLTADVNAAADATLALSAVPTDVPDRGMLRIGSEQAIYRISGGTVTLISRGVQNTSAAPHALGATAFFQELQLEAGWMELVTIRADVVGSNADFIDQLARLVKAYLILVRATFEPYGLTLKDISESDIAPRLPMLPADIYARTLTIQLWTKVSLPESFPIVTGTATEVTTEGDEYVAEPQSYLHP